MRIQKYPDTCGRRGLNLSMFLVFTHNFILNFAFSLKAFIIGGDRFLLQSHIYDLATSIKKFSKE